MASPPNTTQVSDPMFMLGIICERLAQKREVVLARVNYATVAKRLVAKGTADLTESTRKIISSTGLEGQKDGLSFMYAGVFYNYTRHGWKALREILLVEEPQRKILVQRGIPGEYNLIKVSSTNPPDERVRTISSLDGVEKRLDSMLGGRVTLDE
ncbi:MAG: hypothetical protein AABX75_02735 [Nanoarchaeota archaeon]